jgi:hypothetical protein
MQAVVAEIRCGVVAHIEPVFRVPVFAPPYGLVPPGGLEPPPLVPETSALSPELRGP